VCIVLLSLSPRKATLFAQSLALCAIAALLVIQTGFALHGHVQRREMKTLAHQAQHRQAACLELGWRWEADDQENQYHQGDSAGTHTTVGPISGFVMDVTEDEYGHAEGQCHPVNATYTDLLLRY
jgi:hypothetical protein